MKERRRRGKKTGREGVVSAIISSPLTEWRRSYGRASPRAYRKFRAFISTSIDRRVEIDRIRVEKIISDGKGENVGAPLKNCSGPENKNASISLGKHIAIQ